MEPKWDETFLLNVIDHKVDTIKMTCWDDEDFGGTKDLIGFREHLKSLKFTLLKKSLLGLNELMKSYVEVYLIVSPTTVEWISSIQRLIGPTP